MSINRGIGSRQSWLVHCLMLVSLVGCLLINITVCSPTLLEASAATVKIGKSRMREPGQIPQSQSSLKTDITGDYKGFVELPGGVKSAATLNISERIGEAYNFKLKIEGQTPISGRIAVAPYFERGSYPANIRSEDNHYPVMWGAPSISVRLFSKGNRIALKSVEKDKEFIFQTCLPPPGCQEQPKCKPCE